MASKKASALLKSISTELGIRLSSLTRTESVDASGNPTLLIGAAAAKSAGAFIRVISQDWTATDIFGNAATGFSPHTVQMVLEANAQAGGADENDVNTPAQNAALFAAVFATGARVELYVSPTNEVPAVGEITAAQLVSTIDPSPYHGIVANQ